MAAQTHDTQETEAHCPLLTFARCLDEHFLLVERGGDQELLQYLRLLPCSTMGSFYSVLQLIHTIRSQVRQGFALEGGPEVFYRVQLWSIARKPDHFQPVDVCLKVSRNFGATMGREVIPQQGDRPRHLPMECLQIGDDRIFLDRLGLQMQHNVGQAAIGFTYQAANRVEAFPIEAMLQLWRLSTRSPGASNTGFERESALIEEG
jgi:hypothetical protein